MAAVIVLVVGRDFSSTSIREILFGRSASTMSVGLISEALGLATPLSAATNRGERRGGQRDNSKMHRQI